MDNFLHAPIASSRCFPKSTGELPGRRRPPWPCQRQYSLWRVIDARAVFNRLPISAAPLSLARSVASALRPCPLPWTCQISGFNKLLVLPIYLPLVCLALISAGQEAGSMPAVHSPPDINRFCHFSTCCQQFMSVYVWKIQVQLTDIFSLINGPL